MSRNALELRLRLLLGGELTPDNGVLLETAHFWMSACVSTTCRPIALHRAAFVLGVTSRRRGIDEGRRRFRHLCARRHTQHETRRDRLRGLLGRGGWHASAQPRSPASTRATVSSWRRHCPSFSFLARLDSFLECQVCVRAQDLPSSPPLRLSIPSSMPPRARDVVVRGCRAGECRRWGALLTCLFSCRIANTSKC